MTRIAKTLLSLTLLTSILGGCAGMPDPGGWNSFAEKKAQARFKELCDAQAGEHIYKTVDNVEGYLWVSAWPTIGEVWSKEHTRQLRDQYGLADPYDYCHHCLTGARLTGGGDYRYVEIQHTSGKTVFQGKALARKEGGVPASVDVATAQSRYAITFETLGTKEDRDLWIGGGRLTITDRQTGEVLGERAGFVRGSPGFLHANPATGPWARTIGCPNDPIAYISFTEKVLKPVGAKPE